MTSKRDEDKAFKKLIEAVGKRPATLDFEMWVNNAPGITGRMYRSYIGPPPDGRGYITERFHTPMEAVDAVIAMQKEVEE